MQRNRTNPILSELYTLGIPQIEFQKLGKPSTAHTSGHLPVEAHHEREFFCLDEFGPDAELSEVFKFGSAVLGEIGIRSSRRLAFDNESTVQSAVELVLKDVIQLLDLVEKVVVLSECSVTNEVGSKHKTHKADFWIVYLDGRPILVVEVKTPLPGTTNDDDGTNKLTNPNVLGQMFDYLRNNKDFYGATHVFGIVTTMKHWKFVWFPESDALARSSTLPVTDLEISPSPQSRTVCTSQIYKQDDEALPRLLMSLIKKAQSTSFQPVSLLTTARLYVSLRSQSWQWLRPTQAVVDAWSEALTLQLAYQPSPTTEYVVLKHLQRSAEAKVWFALIHNTSLPGTICVIKQMFDLADATREAHLWNLINKCASVAALQVSGRPSVVMPFVVLAKESNIGGASTQVEFVFDAALWGLQNNVLPGDIPVQLEALAASMRAIAASTNLLNARDVALIAVERIAKEGFLHNDIEWRHVALIPEFDASGAVVRLLPGLIDLESLVEAADPAEALATMKQRIDEISQGVAMLVAV